MKVILNQLLNPESYRIRDFFPAFWPEKLLSFLGWVRIKKTGSFYAGNRVEVQLINKNNNIQSAGNKRSDLNTIIIKPENGVKSNQVKGINMLSSGDLLEPESRGFSLFLTSLPPLKGKRSSILSSMIQEAGCIPI